jgi:hypothetical protein
MRANNIFQWQNKQNFILKYDSLYSIIQNMQLNIAGYHIGFDKIVTRGEIFANIHSIQALNPNTWGWYTSPFLIVHFFQIIFNGSIHWKPENNLKGVLSNQLLC